MITRQRNPNKNVCLETKSTTNQKVATKTKKNEPMVFNERRRTHTCTLFVSLGHINKKTNRPYLCDYFNYMSPP